MILEQTWQGRISGHRFRAFFLTVPELRRYIGWPEVAAWQQRIVGGHAIAAPELGAARRATRPHC